MQSPNARPDVTADDIDLDGLDRDAYLRIPYIIEASSVEHAGQVWKRRAEHIELPDCAVEADTIVEALELLEARRVDVIDGLLAAGQRPPVPRPPLPHHQ
jgi:hypothetical protein